MSEETKIKPEIDKEEEDTRYTKEEIKNFRFKWFHLEIIPINTQWAFGVGIGTSNNKELKIRVIKGKFYENLAISGEPGKPITIDLSEYPKVGIKKERGKLVKTMVDIPITQTLKFQIKRTSDLIPLIPIMIRQLIEREKYLDIVDISTRKKNDYKADFKISTAAGIVYAEIKHKMKAVIDDLKSEYYKRSYYGK